jgi:hypothetical protein
VPQEPRRGECFLPLWCPFVGLSILAPFHLCQLHVWTKMLMLMRARSFCSSLKTLPCAYCDGKFQNLGLDSCTYCDPLCSICASYMCEPKCLCLCVLEAFVPLWKHCPVLTVMGNFRTWDSIPVLTVIHCAGAMVMPNLLLPARVWEVPAEAWVFGRRPWSELGNGRGEEELVGMKNRGKKKRINNKELCYCGVHQFSVFLVVHSFGTWEKHSSQNNSRRHC